MHTSAKAVRRLTRSLSGIATAVLLFGTVASDRIASAAPDLPAGATGAGQASTGFARAGSFVQASTYATQPAMTAAQQSQVQAGMAHSNGPGPAFPTYRGPLPAPSGPSVAEPAAAATPPNTLQVDRSSRLPAGGLFSGVGEPSGDNSGKDVFQTGNWYATYSHNNGVTWTYLNPFTIFGGGYCCDQVAVLDNTHQRMFWLLQYNNHLVIANSPVTNLAGWCYYNWFPSAFGVNSFDYNHMAVDANNLFFTTDTDKGVLVARIPIDTQANCAVTGYSYILRNTEFADSFVQTAGDVMFWGSNWTTIGRGNGFRVFRWQDNTGGYNWYDRLIAPFAFLFRGNGQCGSADRVVNNWCWFADSRMAASGYLGIPSTAEINSTDTIIGFAFNAQSDRSHPWPYIRRIYFRASDMTYLGASEQWAAWSAFLYPDLAANAHGHIALASNFGGGTGTTHYYPSLVVTIDDDFSPFQAWAQVYLAFGAGNACDNSGTGQYRWGDYLTVRPWNPTRDVFEVMGYVLTANATSCGFTQPVAAYNAVVGRARDQGSYTRFSGS